MDRITTAKPAHHGSWRLFCALPAVCASAALVVIGLSWLHEFAVLGLAGWMLLGLLLSVPCLERIIVRLAFRFRIPAGADADWLAWLSNSVESRCGIVEGRFDWYLIRDSEPNGFAIGRRSIAVTTGFLHLLTTGRLGHDEAVAVGIHEVGHHRTRGTRCGLLASWLSWPARAAHRAVRRLHSALPFGDAAKILMPVLILIAIVNVAQEERPPELTMPVLVLLITLALGLFAAPLADAAVSRASERAADDYASRLDAGSALAAALQKMAPASHPPLRSRLLDLHPPTATRLHRLAVPR